MACYVRAIISLGPQPPSPDPVFGGNRVGCSLNQLWPLLNFNSERDNVAVSGPTKVRRWPRTVLAAPLKCDIAPRLRYLAALSRFLPKIGALAQQPSTGAQPEDVLDAVVGAWTARRLVEGTALRLGGELDARGLRTEVIA